MKRRYALTGLGLVAAVALVSTAVAGGVPGSGSDGDGAATAAKKKKAKRGPAGPPGPQGVQGAQGPPGADGADGTNGTNGTNGATSVTTRTAALNVNAGTTNSATASCIGSEKATGGGYAQATAIDPANLFVDASRPAPFPGVPTGWFVNLKNTSGSNYVGFAYVICAAP